MAAGNLITYCYIGNAKMLNRNKFLKTVEEVSNLSSIRSTGVLPVIPVTKGSASRTLEMFALSDFGGSLSFVVESLIKTSSLTVQTVELNVAGIHGTSDIINKRFHIKLGDRDRKVEEKKNVSNFLFIKFEF